MIFFVWGFQCPHKHLIGYYNCTDEFTAFNGGQPNFACSNILADSQRYNMDTKANTYGKLLLELCKNTGLIISCFGAET